MIPRQIGPIAPPAPPNTLRRGAVALACGAISPRRSSTDPGRISSVCSPTAMGKAAFPCGRCQYIGDTCPSRSARCMSILARNPCHLLLRLARILPHATRGAPLHGRDIHSYHPTPCLAAFRQLCPRDALGVLCRILPHLGSLLRDYFPDTGQGISTSTSVLHEGLRRAPRKKRPEFHFLLDKPILLHACQVSCTDEPHEPCAAPPKGMPSGMKRFQVSARHRRENCAHVSPCFLLVGFIPDTKVLANVDIVCLSCCRVATVPMPHKAMGETTLLKSCARVANPTLQQRNIARFARPPNLPRLLQSMPRGNAGGVLS